MGPHTRASATRTAASGLLIGICFVAASRGGADTHEFERDPSDIQAYVMAALHGDLDRVRTWLEAGMPVDATVPPRDARYPYTVRTALEAAATYARMDVVRFLLEHGARLRRDRRHGVYAASMHSGDTPELLEVLVANTRPLDPDADFGPALVRAAANGARREVAFLLALGVDPDWRSPDEPWDSPAIVRAGSHFDVVELLLDAGADPTGGELDEAWSPLFPAAGAGNAVWTERLLALGIDPHVEGPRGNALSIAACRSPRTARPTLEAMQATNAVVTLLLARGVDPNRRADGRTPLRCAEDSHDAELAATLAAAGARSSESLWARVSRGVRGAAIAVALLLGGGM